jgi:ribosomal protein S18 acetylase RimI-like enzyme
MTQPATTDLIQQLPFDDPRRRPALSLLLTGRSDPQDPAIDHFLQYARENRIDTSRLYGLVRHGRLVASTMLIVAPGKVGTIYASPPGKEADSNAMAALARQTVLLQNPAEIRLVQAILDPWQHTEEQVFIAAGFKRLAMLEYQQMGPVCNRPDLPALLPGGLSIRTWSPETRPLFEAAILSSYIDTLDCPGLVGVRKIDDILAGHRAAGTFTPGWWFALEAAEGKPAGVMLLSPLPDRATVEVVYLGLAPAWRGQKLGEKLLRGAEGIAFRFGYRNLALAVDEHNPAAVQLYKRLGFRTYARKLALIMVLESL